MNINDSYNPETVTKILEAIGEIEQFALQEIPSSLNPKRTNSGITFKDPLDPGNSDITAIVSNKHGYTNWKENKTCEDAIQLYADINNIDFVQAYNVLKERYGLEDEENTDFSKWINKNQNDIKRWHTAISFRKNEKALNYILDRGITKETIDRFQVGYDNSEGYEGISIPYLDYNDEPVYYAKRFFDASTGDTSREGRAKYTKAPTFNNSISSAEQRVKKAEKEGKQPTNRDIKVSQYTPSSTSEHIIWGLPTLTNISDKEKADTLVIAEGAFDALSVAQEGYPILSPITCNFSGEQQKELFRICRKHKFKRVILTLDNDSSGQNGNHKLAGEFIREGIPFRVAVLPKRKNYEELKEQGITDKKQLYYKDVSEYYQDYHELNKLLSDENTIKGIIYQASKYKDNEYSFRDFVLKHSRKLDNFEIKEILKFASEQWGLDEEFIKDLSKTATSPPSQDLIAKEVEAEHDLLFIDGKYFEYEDNIWVEIKKEKLKQYVNEKLGRFRKNPLDGQIANVITSDIVSDIEFNQKNLLVFEDGTLDCDNFVFRPSRKTDYTDFKLDYSFNPEAEIDCPVFDEFLNGITDGDEKKKQVLLEYGGYGFLPDNRYKKFLYLIGGGNNGKSIYTQLITDVFGGEKSVSSVIYDNFDNIFERIHLKGKMFNLCSEVTKHTRGNESILKAITGGDRITASFKGIDSVSFKCNAKLIFTGNSLPSTDDKVEAFFNRFIIVRLPLSFVDTPIKKKERKADLDLSEKLRQERSSIIKRFIEASKQLKKNKGFTKIEESDYLLAEYKETAVPLVSFLQEVVEDIVLRLSGEGQSDEKAFIDAIGYGDVDEDYLQGIDSLDNEIFVKTQNIYKLYDRYCEESNINKKQKNNFSQEFNELLELKEIGERVNKGRKGRGFIFYKDAIAEECGYKIHKTKNEIVFEEKRNIKNLRLAKY